MPVTQKYIFFVVFFCFVLSCGTIENEQRKTTPNNKVIPSATDKKSELPTKKPELLKPSEIPIKKEEQKKKLKKFDTLKPVVAIP